MDRLYRTAKRKLLDRRGDSIGEVLVSLLISAVALVMLASMIAASTSLIMSSREKPEAYYQENNNLTRFVDGASVSTGKLVYTAGSDTVEIPSVHYRSNALGGKTIVAYWK